MENLIFLTHTENKEEVEMVFMFHFQMSMWQRNFPLMETFYMFLGFQIFFMLLYMNVSWNACVWGWGETMCMYVCMHAYVFMFVYKSSRGQRKLETVEYLLLYFIFAWIWKMFCKRCHLSQVKKTPNVKPHWVFISNQLKYLQLIF